MCFFPLIINQRLDGQSWEVQFHLLFGGNPRKKCVLLWMNMWECKGMDGYTYSKSATEEDNEIKSFY